MPYVVTDDCILCGVCEAGCPTGAAQLGELTCQIDPDVCIECGDCELNCPSGAIIFVEQEESVLSRTASDQRQDAGDQYQRCH
jgi:ferredoxin